MKTIQLEEILNVYKMCGLVGDEATVIRNTLNSGTLNHSLNTGRLGIDAKGSVYNCDTSERSVLLPLT